MMKWMLATLLLVVGAAVAQENGNDVVLPEDYTVLEVVWGDAVGDLEAVEGNRGRGRGQGATWQVQDHEATVYAVTYTYDEELGEFVEADREVVFEGVLPRYMNPGGNWVDGQTLRALDLNDLNDE